MIARLFLLCVAASALAGCMSHEQFIAKRHDKLVEVYPLGHTTRGEVGARWAPIKPELSFKKPAAGWLALEPRYAGKHLAAVESKIKQPIASFERYFGPDGFLSLCRCWFYYDSNDKLVEVEWQYVSD